MNIVSKSVVVTLSSFKTCFLRAVQCLLHALPDAVPGTVDDGESFERELLDIALTQTALAQKRAKKKDVPERAHACSCEAGSHVL